MRFSSCKLVLKYIFPIAAVVAMIYLVDFSALLGIAKQISVPIFSLVCIVVIADQAFMGAKWQYLLKIFHVTVPTSVPIMAYLRGRIYHFVAPSSLGIDAYKTYCVNRYHRGRTAIVSSILVERGFGLLSSLAILLIMLPFSADILDLPFKQHITWVSISGLFFLGLSIHLMQSRADFILNLKFPGFFPAKAHGLLEGLVINLAKVKDGKKNIWFYFLLSIIEKSFYGIAVFLCARTLGITEPGLLFILSVAPVCALLERLPISVSAIGVREGLFVILFAPFHDDPTIPIAVSLVLRLGEVVQIVIFFSTWFIGRNPSVINKELQTVERKYGSKHNQY